MPVDSSFYKVEVVCDARNNDHRYAVYPDGSYEDRCQCGKERVTEADIPAWVRELSDAHFDPQKGVNRRHSATCSDI